MNPVLRLLLFALTIVFMDDTIKTQQVSIRNSLYGQTVILSAVFFLERRCFMEESRHISQSEMQVN